MATVSASGVVTGVGPGTANIAVSGNDDYRYTVVIPVTVNGAQVYGAESVAEADAAAQEAAAQDFAVLRRLPSR